MTGISRKTRAVVLQRAEGRCERCGIPLDGFFYSIQHRRARGMGGSKLPGTNLPGNLVALCGSATTGCHGWTESHPTEAWVVGLRVGQSEDPTKRALKRLDEWVLLADDGTFRVVRASHSSLRSEVLEQL